MFQLLIRYWRSDWKRFAAGGLIMFLSILSHTATANATAELEQVMYVPLRRMLGGSSVVAREGFRIYTHRANDGSQWISIAAPGSFSEDELPAGNWCRTLAVGGSLATGDEAARCTIYGRSVEFASSSYRPTILEGRWLEASDENRPVAAITPYLAHKYGYALGDEIVLRVGSPGAQTGPAQQFQVIGLFTDTLMGGQLVVVPLSVLQDLVGGGKQLLMAAEVSGGLQSSSRERELARQLKGNLQVVSVRSMMAGLCGETESVRRVRLIINLAVMAICLASIASSALFLISSRRGDLAVLLACGVPPWGLALLAGGQVVVVTAAAGLLGTWGYGLLQMARGNEFFAWGTALQVMALATSAAASFGLICVSRVVRNKPMEMLRND